MATFNKVNSFVELLAEGVINFESHTFRVALTNTTMTSSMTRLSDVTEVTAGTGYTTGGNTAAVSSI